MLFRRPQAAFTDGEIDLIPIWLGETDPDMHFGEVRDYSITRHGTRREMGQVSVRFGEGECLYYYGHIGYHVDPPYRGHHYAARACALVRRMLLEAGRTTVVITCDPDNVPSRKTCEALGCELERTVAVPGWIRRRWEISAVKRRYIWHLDREVPGGAPGEGETADGKALRRIDDPL